jgi:hypothetical protein
MATTELAVVFEHASITDYGARFPWQPNCVSPEPMRPASDDTRQWIDGGIVSKCKDRRDQC